MALWRIRGEINFQTVAARTGFVSAYNSWKVGRPIYRESYQVLNAGDELDEYGIPQVTKPTVRADVIFVSDVNNDAVYDWLRNRSTVGVDHVFISAHRCRISGGGPLGNPRYFEWIRT
jgi:hypothetical protein